MPPQGYLQALESFSVIPECTPASKKEYLFLQCNYSSFHLFLTQETRPERSEAVPRNFPPTPLPFPSSERKPAQPTTNPLGPDFGGGYPHSSQAHPSLRSPSMTQMPTPPPISDSSRGLRFRAVNDPTHEQDPGAEPAPAMDDIPTIRGGGGRASGGHGHRADAGPELTRRAVGPRLYHKKSRMGCLRCKARRVKVSYLSYAYVYSMLRPTQRVGCVTRPDGGHYICTSYHSSRDLVDLLLVVTGQSLLFTRP